MAVEDNKATHGARGHLIESIGTDGTGFAGGVDYRYWKNRLRHFADFAKDIFQASGEEPIPGVDYPTAEQMEIAREFAKRNQ